MSTKLEFTFSLSHMGFVRLNSIYVMNTIEVPINNSYMLYSYFIYLRFIGDGIKQLLFIDLSVLINIA